MSALKYQKDLIAHMSRRMNFIMHERANIPREELEYVASKLNSMRDERLKSAVAGLIGWGDDERAELETFIAVSIEVMKVCSPSKLREAAKLVEIRSHVKLLQDEGL